MLNTIIPSDALTALRTIPDATVNCCITSPPYFGLRDYGTATWHGGDPDCKHSLREETNFENCKQSTNRGNSKPPKNTCPKCGATRIDRQIGLEDTPEIYIEKLVEIFTEVRRTLKPDATLWINIGDSYWGGKGYSGASAGDYQYQRRKAGKTITKEYSNIGGKNIIRPTDRKHPIIKPKDLIGIPWMLAFALRDAGWYLRQDIIWHKPNPMPESVADRCTKAHEYIFLLSKSSKYYFDSEAIREPAAFDGRQTLNSQLSTLNSPVPARNKRDVWTVATKPYPESHFATFPEKLILDCIKAACPEGGTVLDPFMGAGTTALVARKLNRNYIGIELNPQYITLANRRLRNELGLFQ
jgi:DNA modification methylase